MLRIQIFNSSKRRIHHEIYKRVWDNSPANFTESFLNQNIELTFPFSIHYFYNLKTAYTNGSLRYYDPLKQLYFSTPKKFLIRFLIIPRERVTSTDSAHICLDCVPTTVAQLYAYLSTAFDHRLNDKALKSYKTLASQQ